MLIIKTLTAFTKLLKCMKIHSLVFLLLFLMSCDNEVSQSPASGLSTVDQQVSDSVRHEAGGQQVSDSVRHEAGD
jgi:hypothetical protein